MEAARSLRRYSQQLHDSLPEVAEEFGVSIADDGVREAVTSDDIVQEEPGCACGLLILMSGYEVNHFCCPIRQSQHGVVGSYIRGPWR